MARINSPVMQNSKYPEIICVRSVEPRQGFIVHLVFTDGTERDVDLRPYIGTGPIFAPLRRDPVLFRQVFVDPESQTLTWPNGADIAPETLYYEGPPPWANEAKTRSPHDSSITRKGKRRIARGHAPVMAS